MWFSRRTGRRAPIGRRFRQRFRRPVMERLEGRLLLASGSLEIVLDPIFDTVGFQPETTQFYEDRGSLGSIFDTGASVVTFSALDQLLMDPFGTGTGIPIKVPGGAEAEGIGGTLTGDVSEPGTVLVDGIHVNVFSGNIFDSGSYFDQLQGRGSVAAASSTSQLTGDAALNAEDDVYNGFSLVFTSTSPGSAANLNIYRTITDYDGATRTFTFASGFPAVPEIGDTLHIIVGQGVTAGPLPARERLSANPAGLGLSGSNDQYVGRYLLFTSGVLAGDYQLITGYEAATGTFELALPFSRRPAVGDTFDVVVGTGGSAVMPGVQVFVGTLDGSQILPTISGTPMLNSTTGLTPSPIVGPQPLHPNGLALEVGPQELLLDLGELLGDLDPFLGTLFEGITLPIPSVQFRQPGTQLTSIESFFAESTVVDPSQTATAGQFTGNSELPGDPEFQDFFVGFHLRFLTGSLQGEIQQVSGYDAATRTFTFDTSFSAAPADGDVFELVRTSTDPVTLGLDFIGFDNHLDPDDVMTVSYNPVSSNVAIAQGATTLGDQVFLFDTGAQISTINVAQALALGFDLSAPEFTMSVQGAAGVVEDLPGFTMDELSIPTLEGGTLTFRNVPVFVIDVAEEVQGLLGMNLFNSAAEFLYDPFDPMDPNDPNDDRPTVEITFFNQRSEVAPEEIDTSQLDPLQMALLASLAELMPGAFGGFVGLTGIALPNFGVGVDLDLVPQNGVVGKENGVTMVTVTPGTPINFEAAVAYAAEFYDAFQLDFAASDTALTLGAWNTDPAWTTTDGTLSFPGDSSVSAFGAASLSQILGTFVVDAPATPGDYLLSANDGAGNTQFTLTGLADPLPLRDFGDIIIRVRATPSLAIGDATLIEGADGAVTDLQFTVTLTGDATGTVSVDYATADDSAQAAGGDYASTSGTLQFAPGETEKVITVPVHGDWDLETDETFFVDLTNPSIEILPMVLVPVSDVTGVDQDGDIFDPEPFDLLEADDAVELRTDAGPPKRAFAMEFDVSGVPAGATINSATLTFVETTDTVDPSFLLAGVYGYAGDADGVVTLANPFNILLSNQVGSVGNRSVGTESVNVTSFVQSLITAGDTFAGFYIESALDLYYIHSSEATDPANRPTLTINYSAGPVTVEIGDPQGAAMIRNDDTEISLSDRQRTEGDAGQAEAVFVLRLSQPSALQVTVDYATSGGTATTGADYQPVGGTVVFAPGEVSKAVSVPILGDVEVESSETFFVELSGPTNATLATTQATGTILDNDPEPLGPITYLELDGLDPSSGDLWYRCETTRQGFLTIVSLDAGGDLTLYDANQNALTPGGDQRIDWQVGAGETYQFKLSGAAGPIDLRLANLVSQAGTAVAVAGTDEADQFEFDPAAASRLVTINGIPYHFSDAEAQSITFDGGTGDDSVVFQGTAGPETVELWPDRGVLAGNGYTLTITGALTVTVNGRGGDDVAKLHDSKGPDVFDAGPDSAALSGTGYAYTVNNVRYVHAYASNDAYIDTASFSDSATTKDTFIGQPGQSRLYGPDFYLQVKGFEQVTATAAAAGPLSAAQVDTDVAKLYDSAAPDLFEGTPDAAKMKYNGLETHFVEAVGFRYVNGYALTKIGGTDTASFSDSATTRDTFIGQPGQSKLYGPEFYLWAKGFEQVAATATAGGGYKDLAKLYDSQWPDTFEGTPDYGKLKFNNSESHFVQAIGFRYVHARATTGDDTAALYDADNSNDRFQGWLQDQSARMFGSSFSNWVGGFREVHAYAEFGSGDTDRAYLYDSTGDDYLLARDADPAEEDWVKLCDAADVLFALWAHGFDKIFADSGEGDNDTADLGPNLDAVPLLTGTWEN